MDHKANSPVPSRCATRHTPYDLGAHFPARRCQRVALSIFLCFFLRMRLRRFFISDPMSLGTLVGTALSSPNEGNLWRFSGKSSRNSSDRSKDSPWLPGYGCKYWLGGGGCEVDSGRVVGSENVMRAPPSGALLALTVPCSSVAT